MTLADRVLYAAFDSTVMSAEEAAAQISDGANVGMSGVTGAGSPKAVPLALARRIDDLDRDGIQVRDRPLDRSLDGARAEAAPYFGGVIGAHVDEPAPTMSIPVLSITTFDSSAAGE